MRTLSVFIVTALLIFSQSCLHNKFEDSISKLHVEKLVVIEQKELYFKDSAIIGLSPDGCKLAVYNSNNRRLSVHDADTQEEITGMNMKSSLWETMRSFHIPCLWMCLPTAPKPLSAIAS